MDYINLDFYKESIRHLKMVENEILIKVRSGEEITSTDTGELRRAEQEIEASAKAIVTLLMEKHGGRCYENTVIWNDC